MPKDNITLLPLRDRAKLLEQRLNRLRYDTGERLTPLPKSAKVLAAEKTVSEWQDRNDEYVEAQRAVLRAQHRAIVDALILGDTKQALALLHKAEAV